MKRLLLISLIVQGCTYEAHALDCPPYILVGFPKHITDYRDRDIQPSAVKGCQTRYDPPLCLKKLYKNEPGIYFALCGEPNK